MKKEWSCLNWNTLNGSKEGGFLYIPLALVTVVIAVAGFGVWGVMRDWRFLVETQLRLNRCVGQIALQLKDVLNEIEQLNRRIYQLRLSILAAQTAQPELIPALQATLSLQVARQESLLIQWKVQKAHWAKNQVCGSSRDWAAPLPNLLYQRDPPDSVGPQELKWPGGSPGRFYIYAKNGTRSSGAKIYTEKVELEDFPEEMEKFTQGSSAWRARWSLPGGFVESGGAVSH